MTLALKSCEEITSWKVLGTVRDDIRLELCKFFERVDGRFLPSLSNMYGNVDNVIEELSANDAEVLVARNAGGIRGCLGYWRVPGNDIYAHILAVGRDVEGTGFPFRLIMEAVCRERHAPPSCVFGRTWSTNRHMIRMFRYLGFTRYSVITHDFGGARTSYWYRCVWRTLVARCR